MATARGVIESIQGASLVGFHLLTPFLRGWRTRWGASPEEIEGPLPGDEVVPEPRWQYTHAVPIARSPEDVWPWLVQIGQGRGGFYSYEVLENVIGCRIRNVDRIVSELQDLAPGDPIRLHPETPALVVAQIDPPRSLVLAGAPGPDAPPGVAASWLFHIAADAAGARLVTRFRVAHPPDLGSRLGYGPWFVEPVSFVMERRMLLGIKALAEGATA